MAVKKKVLLIVTGIILVLLLLPVPLRLDDGGSILYSAALY